MLLTIAAVVAAAAVVNAVYPAVTQGSSSLTSATNRISTRMESKVTVIHATGELNASGNWVDTNSDGDFDIFAWVKNVGTARIDNVTESDLFVGQTGDFQRVPHQTYAGGNKPLLDILY